MTNKNIFLIFAMIVVLIGWTTNVGAEGTGQGVTVTEVGVNYVKGSYSGGEIIKVYKNNEVLGEGKASSGKYSILFKKTIAAKTELIIIIGENKETQKKIVYSPPIVNKVDDKARVVSGKAVSGGKVQAYVKGRALSKSPVTSNGSFKFAPSSLLKYGTSIHVVFEVNGLKSTATAKVAAAPAPGKPRVNSISDKNTYIAGYAEPGSKVYITAGGKNYTVKTSSVKGYYKQVLSKKLIAGSMVYTYAATDRHNSKSPKVSIKVADKTPPKVPVVNKITNKSFSITGITEKSAKVYISKDGKHYKTVKANSKGSFSLRMPQKKSKTKFEFYAKDSAGNKSSKRKVIVSNKKRPSKKVLSAPLVRQMPELPRGCEVTSLAMMLNHAGVKANKMTLAKQVKRDPAKQTYIKGKKHFGNPNYGFVGDMYSFKTPGFGVFNKPIEALAKEYMPGRIVNLTGKSFDTVLSYVAAGRPVWIINTSWFSYVPSQYWQTWYTKQGPVRITMKEHSVLVTGYDSKYVYFNDPLDGKKNKKRLKKHFVEGWTQYGKQAISYY